MSSAFGVVCESMPLVTVVILVALWAIPKRASATTRHQVLVVAALLSLAAPLLLRGMPDWQVLPRPSAPVMAAVAPALREEAPVLTGQGAAAGNPSSSVAVPAAHAEKPAAAQADYRYWFRLAAALWLAGAVVAALRIACNAAALRRWVLGSSPASAELEQLAASIPGPKVRLRIVEGEGDAFVYRIFSPVVVLPVSVASLPHEQVRMVLEHELAHVRRRDPLWAWVFEAFRAVYWFHPLAWLLVKRSHLAREMAADDLVLLDGRNAEAYAACLGAAALRHQSQAPPPLPALAFVRQHPVLARLHAILDARRRRVAPSTGGWLAVGLPLAVPALVIASLGFKAAAEAQPAQRRLPKTTARMAPTPSLWSDLIEPMVSAAPADPQPSMTDVSPAAPVAASRSMAPLPPAAQSPRPRANRSFPDPTTPARHGAAPESSTMPVVSLPESSANHSAQVTAAPEARGFGFRRPVPPTPPTGPTGSTPTPTPPTKGPDTTPTPVPETPGSEPKPPTPPTQEPGSGTDDPGSDDGAGNGDNGSENPPDSGEDPDEPGNPPPPSAPDEEEETGPTKPKPPPPSSSEPGTMPALKIIPYETDAGSHFAVSWSVTEADAATWSPEISSDQRKWTSDPSVLSVEGPLPMGDGTVRFIAVIIEPMPNSFHRFLRLTNTPGMSASE